MLGWRRNANDDDDERAKGEDLCSKEFLYAHHQQRNHPVIAKKWLNWHDRSAQKNWLLTWPNSRCLHKTCSRVDLSLFYPKFDRKFPELNAYQGFISGNRYAASFGEICFRWMSEHLIAYALPRSMKYPAHFLEQRWWYLAAHVQGLDK